MILTKYEAVLPMAVWGKEFLIGDANNLDKKNKQFVLIYI